LLPLEIPARLRVRRRQETTMMMTARRITPALTALFLILLYSGAARAQGTDQNGSPSGQSGSKRRPAGIEGVWKIEVQPEALAERNGEGEYEETLTFSGGMLATDDKIGLPPAQYTLSPSGDKTVSFTAVQEGDEKGRYAWSGTLRAGELLGTLLRIMPNGSEVSYSFRGERQQTAQ
jgi:hypothetical protein